MMNWLQNIIERSVERSVARIIVEAMRRKDEVNLQNLLGRIAEHELDKALVADNKGTHHD